MTDSRPLAPDVAFVLEHLQPMLIARGLPLDRLGNVAFGLAMDARIVARMKTATAAEEHEALEQVRLVQQFMTRACLFGLGLLRPDEVEPVPRDESGRDVQLAEWFPLPSEELMAVAAAYLARLDEEDDDA